MSHKTLILFALAGTLSFPAERGMAQQTEPRHLSGPIQNGVKHQPTRVQRRSGECLSHAIKKLTALELRG